MYNKMLKVMFVSFLKEKVMEKLVEVSITTADELKSILDVINDDKKRDDPGHRTAVQICVHVYIQA